MSNRGIRIYPYVRNGGRYTSGAQLVSSSYGTAVSTSTGPSPGPAFKSTDWAIWALAGVWSTMPQSQSTTIAPVTSTWDGHIWALASVWSTGTH